MSRFVNLELGGESEDLPPQQKTLEKNEAYYLNEARTAFENGNFEPALRFTPRFSNSTPTTPPPGRRRCGC